MTTEHRNHILRCESRSASRREWSVNHIGGEDSDKAGVPQRHPSHQIPLPATRIHRTTTDRAAISPKMRGRQASQSSKQAFFLPRVPLPAHRRRSRSKT